MKMTLIADGTKLTDWLAGWGAIGAAVVAVVAIVVSLRTASASSKVNYQITGSGYKASEEVLTDLAVLLAALRSIATKGALATQDPTPLTLDTELEAVRRFLTSTSGLALSLHAGRVGSAGASDDPVAGSWRVLRMNLTRLSLSRVVSASDNQQAGFAALEIEKTISSLDKASIKSMQAEITDLPTVLSSLTTSRQQDILVGSFFSVFSDRRDEAEAWQKAAITRLRALKAVGVDDPDIDFRLGLESDGDVSELRDAVARGADMNLELSDLLDRYEDFGVGADDESEPDQKGVGTGGAEEGPGGSGPDEKGVA